MDIKPMAVVPTRQQVEYQRMELIGFIHYTVNAFTDREWGEGTESLSIFNPTALDTRQWVQAAKEAGILGIFIEISENSRQETPQLAGGRFIA